jgi:hypothetical protein
MLDMNDENDRAFSARQMLDELAWSAASLRDEHAQLEAYVVAALDPMIGLLMDAESRGTGERHFAVRQLLARSINDLVSALHLETHGYLTQAYGMMRMAYETLDLIELLATSTEEAERWVNGDRPWVDFAPANVRERLGKPRLDEVYSQLSEFAHPRFEASKLSTAVRRNEGGDVPTVVVRLGPFFLDELPDHWLCAGFLVPLIGTLSVRASHLALLAAVSEAAWEDAAVQCNNALVSLGQLVAEQLARHGVEGASGFGASFGRAEEILRGYPGKTEPRT